jgi:hypothetical protein
MMEQRVLDQRGQLLISGRLLDSRQPSSPRHPMRCQVPIVAGATSRRDGL